MYGYGVPLREAKMKMEDGIPMPASAFLHVPDPDLPSTWKLPIWDKDKKIREQLKREVAKHKNLSCRVINRLQDLPDHTVDLCVFANVLHELTPDVFGEIIHQACRKLVAERHLLIVLELYPLLTAEKFAVCYPPDNLSRIFRNLGFISTYQIVPVRDTSAYCLAVKREPDSQRDIEAGHISETVSEEWRAILSNALEKYAMTYQIDDYHGYRDVTQCLTTIASICAWQAGKWHSS